MFVIINNLTIQLIIYICILVASCRNGRTLYLWSGGRGFDSRSGSYQVHDGYYPDGYLSANR